MNPNNAFFACVHKVQSPVESVTMSPVERTAAWILHNGQYEDEEEEGPSKDDAKHVEKVKKINCSKYALDNHYRRF